MRDTSPGTYESPGTWVPVYVGYSDPNTRLELGPTRIRTGSDRFGYYPSDARRVDERGTGVVSLAGC